MILITLGVLFLLQEYWYIPFDETWPILLIVIGLFAFASRSASTEGHIQPWWARGRGEAPNSESRDPRRSGTDPQVKL